MAEERAMSVTRKIIRELYYITHVDNIPSILKRGILSHARVRSSGIRYTPVYDEEIVAARSRKTVPDGRSLWDFANVYFQARNPMMYRVVAEKGADEIAVIGVKRGILGQDGTYVTDGNAANQDTTIYPGREFRKLQPRIIRDTDRDWWNVVDGSKRKIMTEYLVPGEIAPEHIEEIFVANSDLAAELRTRLGDSRVYVLTQPDMFFQPQRSSQLTDHLSVVDGDMFFSRLQTLTVSVNCVGVMGKGLASRAKYQFPDVYVNYQDSCRSGRLKLGKPYLYKRESSFDQELADEPQGMTRANGETWFILFPTKHHWRDHSEIGKIEEGLQWVKRNYRDMGLKSLAVPALGCGLGGLDWKDVGPVMCRYLALDIPVQIYLPAERHIPDKQIEKPFLMPGSL